MKPLQKIKSYLINQIIFFMWLRKSPSYHIFFLKKKTKTKGKYIVAIHIFFYSPP